MQHLGEKLQLKRDENILLLNMPPAVAQLFAEGGYNVVTEYRAGCKFNIVQLFVHNKAELEKFAQVAIDSLNQNGSFWIAYPKLSSGFKSDITRDKGWNTIYELGYTGVRQISIDDIWSSLRFKHASERKEPSKMGAEYEGVDKANKIVTPPADMQIALEEAGLNAKFQALTYSCKREYVIAVLGAKRAETRISRITKIIEQVAIK